MKHFRLIILIALAFTNASGQSIIAYYSGDARAIDQYPVGQLTHLIYSFCYLRGSRLYAGRKDSITIRKLVSLKKAHPSLKVLLSLGGWGGCRNCSAVFSTDKGRAAFARSVREMIDHFGADGIDLDWEFPTLGGYPGHPFSATDKENFTRLLKEEPGDTFISYEDERSVKAKVAYVKEKGLNGIMFWELRLDKPVNGLLSVIYNGWH